jgi:CubicO group peptidase (beta-lactamase class C family)
MNYTLRISALMFILLFQTLVSAQKTDYTALEKKLEKALTDWNVPGMSVSIVKDDKIVFSKGFGVLEKGKTEKVNPQSVFAIASISKAFTSASLARLVDEGKLNWDDKVIDYLPYFRLYNPYVTANFTIEDLLCHRSGLGTFSGDLLWYGTTHSREEVVKRARFLTPEFEFRDGYGYQNIMFVAAGLVLEKVSGQTWEKYVSQHFLTPLSMKRTYTSVNDVVGIKNLSIPHSGTAGENAPIAYINWDNMAPAGALLSTTEDLCQWMKLQLNRGIWGADTIFSPNRSQEMWTVHNAEPVSRFAEKTFPGLQFRGYGLGWDIFNYRGRKIINHGGGYDGMVSKLVMVPEENLGFVILTNANSALSHVMMYTILDQILSGLESDTDWSAFYLPRVKGGDEAEKARAAELFASVATPPNHSLDLKDYAGTFGGEMYGNMTIKLENDTLRFQMEPTPLYHGWLQPLNHNSFILHWGETHFLPVGTVEYTVNYLGEATELKVAVPNPDLFFEELEFKRIKH